METCKIENCRRKHYGRGYCKLHWKRWWRYGNPMRTKIELHGKKNTPEYRSWTDVKRRCYNRNNAAYYRYGGRGITVCNEWKGSFIAFLKDMGPKPFPKAEIDRIDNDGNYIPDNCHWVTSTENARNGSRVKLTMDKAEEIRKLYKAGNITQREIGVIFGVAPPTIADVISSRHWKR